jgi:hypothetical protein
MLVKQHDANAEIVTARRADELMERGGLGGPRRLVADRARHCRATGVADWIGSLMRH